MRQGRGVAPRPEVSADAVRAAGAVWACAAAPAHGGRPMFPLRGHIGVDGRYFQIFRGEESPKLWKTFVERRQPLLEARAGLVGREKPTLEARPGRCLHRGNRLSMLGRTFVCNGTNCSRSSGAPGRFRAARPTAASRRNLLPPSSAAGVVQASRPYSVSRADGTGRHSGIGKCRARLRLPTDVPASRSHRC